MLYTDYHEPARFTAEQLRSYGYLDKDIMIEDEEIFQDEFVNLLKNCYSHAPFYDETSNWTYDKHVERRWCVEIVTVIHPLAEDKFIEYVHSINGVTCLRSILTATNFLQMHS